MFKNNSFLSLKTLGQLFLAAFLFCLLLVLTQDVQIFPWLLYRPFLSAEENLKALDPKLENELLKTSDGDEIDIWHLPAAGDGTLKKGAAIIFRGNGGPLRGFFSIQNFLSSLGMESYIFDYRGYGRSSGWPSEKKIYADAEAVWDYVIKKEQLTPAQMTLFGISIGTGPAAFLAEKKKARALVLLSPYTSIPELARERPFIGLLSPFLWYSFPTREYVSKLDDTCLLVFHGKKDSLINLHHGKEVFRSYRGRGKASFTLNDDADHNSLFHLTKNELGEKIRDCFLQ